MGRRRSSLLLVLAAFVVVLVARPAAAAAGPTNDPMSGDQAGLIDIKAPQAWARGKGGGTSIAIVSSGIGVHPDLAGRVDVGYVATGGNARADASGRGTRLAGIVGAATDNGIGIAGVARDARLLAYKAFDSDSATADGYVKALAQAGNARPTVVLVDIPDGYGSFGELRNEMKKLGDAGISVVVGAHDGLILDDLPVLAVAATGTSPSRVGPKGVAAPGGNILSTTVTTPLIGSPVYGYGTLSGTGQAAAHVAGAVAILRGIGASPTQAADFLRSTARKGDPSLGAGSIDVAAAANAFKTPPTTTTTKKAATTTTTTTAAAKAPAGPTGPLDPAAVLSGETPEPGANEAAVAPPGATDPGQVSETGGPSMVVGGHERPWGMLTVGFGLLFGVGTAMSVTFRRLADAAV